MVRITTPPSYDIITGIPLHHDHCDYNLLYHHFLHHYSIAIAIAIAIMISTKTTTI